MMNDSLIYLNNLIFSEETFDKVWEEYQCVDSPDPLIAEIQSKASDISLNIDNLDENLRQKLADSLKQLIDRCNSLYAKYLEWYKYFDFGVYITQPAHNLDLIDDPEALEEDNKRAIEYYNSIRDDKLIEYKRKRDILLDIEDILLKVYNRLKIEQITIPGLDMERNVKSLVWQKTDTDLLELVAALVESGSITNSKKNLSRKEAIEVFSQFFGIEIKDAESKLSRATNRKKDVAQYLTTLKTTFEDYAESKDDRLDSLRK